MMSGVAIREDLMDVPVSNFYFTVPPSRVCSSSDHSCFDKTLVSAWEETVTKGLFRYEINIEGSRVLPGRWSFLAELNIQRGAKRRAPQDINSLKEPFDVNQFNFTQIHPEEVILRLNCVDQSGDAIDQDLVAVNVSPINKGHCLLLPAMKRMFPQILTEHSLILGIRVLLMSKSATFRVVFNSLCAHASVNHLHLHLLYINHCMHLESSVLHPLSGPCFDLGDYPARGFAFQCVPSCEADIIQLSRDVYKLTNFLQLHNEAHNVCITRARASMNDCSFSAVRVFVWVRTPSSGSKTASAFNVAACELFGYILFKERQSFEESSENDVASALERVTAESFERIRPHVKKLFSSF